ncbi:hypothetical protein MFLAVUS_001842 [Mucor flavus]|uniref:Uncharacterized protein n=1 Tax=Mucor flavus TaxID=439312 RepID=A0ABP9YNN1_9FUNG
MDEVYDLHRYTYRVAFREDSWNVDDRFLFKVVSEVIGLFVKELVGKRSIVLKQTKDTNKFHYAFVVPSEWEEEIREALIRPIFVRVNLISEDDHKNRFLFCTDVEFSYYCITQYPNFDDTKLSRNTIMGVIDVAEESKASIVLSSILIGNPLLDFSDSLLFPKLVASESSFLTTDDVKNGTREFIKTKSSFHAQEETIKHVIEEISCDDRSRKIDEYLKKPFITDRSISELDKKHATLIKSIRPIDICAEIKWSEYMLVYNRISCGYNYIIATCLKIAEFDYPDALKGAVLYMFDALQNSDLDISLESTVLSFSLLDENGLVKEIWNHDYFVPDTNLRFLSPFFSFLEETTLNVKNSFIAFVDEYFINDPPPFFNDEYDVLDKPMMTETKDVLNVEGHDNYLLVSTQQQVCAKEFVQIYMIYINDIISRKPPKITARNTTIKITYAITIDNMLLKKLFGTEDDLRDIIYASNMNCYNEEVLFPVIQQSFNLQFPLKYFFVVAQLYEDYVELMLNQVVTEPGLENEYQEAIIVQEEMIPIPNIYKSLCFNMWSSITVDSSLIQLCDKHKGHDDNELLEIFTLEN